MSEMFGLFVNEKSSRIKWEIRESRLDKYSRKNWVGEKSKAHRREKEGEKRSEGGKKESRVVHFCKVKSINTEAQKKAFKVLVSYLSAFIFLSFLSFLFHSWDKERNMDATLWCL